jgi:photosystem II stability/assembly factor-like uncharacterized protein
MSRADAFQRSEWTPRDLLAIVAAVAALIAVTGALATREQWSPLVGANANVPVVISTFNTADYHALAFDPHDPNIVYFGHHYGVMKSLDGGRTWASILREGDAMNLAIVDGAVIMAGHEVFQRTDDGGRTWKKIATNLPDHDIHGFAVSPMNGKTFFAFIVSYGLWGSDDSGATWTLISKELPDTVLVLVVAPTSPETMYAGTMDKGLLKSDDGGKTWKPANGFSGKMAMTLTQDPQDPRVIYAGTQAGLYKSNAEGTQWSPVGLKGKDLMTVAISRANPSRILTVDAQGRVYRSDDAGATWNGK